MPIPNDAFQGDTAFNELRTAVGAAVQQVEGLMVGLRGIIQEGPDGPNAKLLPPICKALVSKDPDRVKRVLEEDPNWIASVRATDAMGITVVLFMGMAAGMHDTVSMLILHIAGEMSDEERHAALMTAALGGMAKQPASLRWMEELVKYGTSLEDLGSLVSGREGDMGVLFMAVLLADMPLVDFCLSHGANPNHTLGVSSDPSEKLPMIMLAACGGNVEVVKKLLSAGADISFKIGMDPPQTVMQVITDRRNSFSPEIRELFTFSAASLAVQSAIREGDVSALKGVNAQDVDSKDHDQRTPLHRAAACRNAKTAVEMVKHLLALGAEVTVADKDGWTPLFYAADVGHEDVVKLIVDANNGATEHRDKSGASALHVAAKRCHLPVVRLLLRGSWALRADVRDSQGLRPCDVVDPSQRDSSQVYSFLVKRSHSYDFFLSHVQREAGPVVRRLHDVIEQGSDEWQAWKGSRAWLDINEEPNPAGMIKGIEDSSVFLMYLTPLIFTRKWCRFEVCEAVRRQKPLLLIRHADEAFVAPSGGSVVVSFEALRASLNTVDNWESDQEADAFKKLVDVLLTRAVMVNSTCDDLMDRIYKKLDNITSEVHAPIVSGWVDPEPMMLCTRGVLAKLPKGQPITDWKREHVTSLLTAVRVSKERQAVFEDKAVTGKVLWSLSEGRLVADFRLTTEEAAKLRRIGAAINMFAQMIQECDMDGSGTIDEDEMLEFMQTVYHIRQKDVAAVKQIFALLDKNSDGQIQAEEFVSGFNAYAVFAGVQ